MCPCLQEETHPIVSSSVIGLYLVSTLDKASRYGGMDSLRTIPLVLRNEFIGNKTGPL